MPKTGLKSYGDAAPSVAERTARNHLMERLRSASTIGTFQIETETLYLFDISVDAIYQ